MNKAIKTIKLKNKTELRKVILNGYNTPLIYKKLIVYNDGSWGFIGVNEDILNNNKIDIYHTINNNRYIGNNGNYTCINKAITDAFKEIDIWINTIYNIK